MSAVQGTKKSPIERYPIGTGDEYIAARNELLKAEWELRDLTERVAGMRRSLPQGAVMKSYTFHEGPRDVKQPGPITTVTLADLIPDDGRCLVVEHIMFGATDDAPCGMCAPCVDGTNAIVPHLAEHANFVVIGRGPIKILREYAARRGWDKVRLLSSSESDFNADMHVEKPAWLPTGDQIPAISVFKKDGDGTVRHFYTQIGSFDLETGRAMDGLSPIWTILDLLPQGRGEKDMSNDNVELKT